MGMKIVAQRRRPELSSGDGIADEVLGAGQVSQLCVCVFVCMVCVFIFCFSWCCFSWLLGAAVLLVPWMVMWLPNPLVLPWHLTDVSLRRIVNAFPSYLCFILRNTHGDTRCQNVKPPKGKIKNKHQQKCLGGSGGFEPPPLCQAVGVQREGTLAAAHVMPHTSTITWCFVLSVGFWSRGVVLCVVRGVFWHPVFRSGRLSPSPTTYWSPRP